MKQWAYKGIVVSYKRLQGVGHTRGLQTVHYTGLDLKGDNSDLRQATPGYRRYKGPGSSYTVHYLHSAPS